MEATEDQLILATGGYDHTIKVWQTSTGNCIKTMRFVETSQVNALDRTPDKTRLAACGYQCIRLYDLDSNCTAPVINFDAVQKNVTRLGFQEDGKWMFTAGEDHRVRIWDMISAPPHCSRVFDCQAPVNAACLHPNQVEIAMGSQNGGVYLWDVKSELHEQLVPELEASIQDVAISPDGHYMAAANNKGNCYIWELSISPGQMLSTINPKKMIQAHNRSILRCKFSPDSRLLVTTSGNGSACIWKTGDFSKWRELTIKNYWIWDAAFSADSKLLFTASSDGVARLWKLETKTCEREYTGHSKAITALSFNDETFD
ncbi:protein LST8 homolog [Drosophila grimshawi]|uniref:Protein LST8 n=1 Tax=Drosophila grimshawi TaxID=7222 RepID=B4JMI4_DROGR|nr:protein LST8 homolog [Drosophila grimshawi]EDV91927.1 GH24634 [Drosophila grimshawi]DBA35965.1 TPA: Lst8 [Drosophila grimshawi]